MRHSRPDGNSIFGSPVYILDTLDQWQVAIKSIQQKWRFVSITLELLQSTPAEISILSTYCLNGPVYLFDFLSIGQATAKKHMKAIVENKEIFKVVYDLEEIGKVLWNVCGLKLVYTIDALAAYNISTSFAMDHKIHISNFCSWIGKVNIPFLQEISTETEDREYWRRRPVIYIMQCYLSGTVSVLMKAWLDIRVGLSDDQVHAVFNYTKEVIAKISGEILITAPKSPATPLVFNSSLSNFSFDKLCIYQAFDRRTNLTNKK
jgi:hypothetical protein